MSTRPTRTESYSVLCSATVPECRRGMDSLDSWLETIQSKSSRKVPVAYEACGRFDFALRTVGPAVSMALVPGQVAVILEFFFSSGVGCPNDKW